MKNILENRPLMLAIIFIIVSITSAFAGNVLFRQDAAGKIALTADSIESNTGIVDFSDEDIKTTGNLCDGDSCFSVDELRNAPPNYINYTKTVTEDTVVLRFDIP